MSDTDDTVKQCYATWSGDYYNNYYGADAPYPPVHIDIVKSLLKQHQCQSVLDAGCGPASMLRELNDLPIERYGFDITPQMVVEARRVLHKQGIAVENIWEGSVINPSAFHPPQTQTSTYYDAVICFGVLPHIPTAQDRTVLRNMIQAVKPGGLVLIEARNQLFSLFTLNRYSHDFFHEHLIDSARLMQQADEEKDALQTALRELDTHFRKDLPPLRTGNGTTPGYDEILSRTHNPFELHRLAQDCGLHDVQTLFYHYHALPPMLQHYAPKLFRKASLNMEDPHDWRGYFMASAFILSGVRR